MGPEKGDVQKGISPKHDIQLIRPPLCACNYRNIYNTETLPLPVLRAYLEEYNAWWANLNEWNGWNHLCSLLNSMERIKKTWVRDVIATVVWFHFFRPLWEEHGDCIKHNLRAAKGSIHEENISDGWWWGKHRLPHCLLTQSMLNIQAASTSIFI